MKRFDYFRWESMAYVWRMPVDLWWELMEAKTSNRLVIEQVKECLE